MFEILYYKGKSKIPMLFETVLQLQLHDIQIDGRLILHVVHVSGNMMIEKEIYGPYIDNYMGGIKQGI